MNVTSENAGGDVAQLGAQVPASNGSLPATLRVAYVITRSDTIGGAHVHVALVASHLRTLGAEVCVFVGGDGPYTAYLRDLGVEHVELRHLCRPVRPRQEPCAFWELRQALCAFGPDLVSTHSAKAGILGRLAARSAGIPVIFTAHGWAFTEGVRTSRRLLYSFIERLAAPLAERVITVSEYDRALALRHGVAGSERLVAIHNGMPDVDPGLRAHPKAEPARLVSVARLDQQKDHTSLLRALAALKHLPWQLELVGDGPKEKAVRSLVAELGLGGRVRFLGLRRDVPRLLARAQIFLLVSRWEGLPRSVIEAMRAGLPVVASDVGGLPELVAEGFTGHLVKTGDLPSLTQRIERLLKSPEARVRLGEAGRRRFREKFHFDRMVGRTLDVYREVLRGRR